MRKKISIDEAVEGIIKGCGLTSEEPNIKTVTEHIIDAWNKLTAEENMIAIETANNIAEDLINAIKLYEKKFPVHFIVMNFNTKSLLANSEQFQTETDKQAIYGKPIALCESLRLGEVQLVTCNYRLK